MYMPKVFVLIGFFVCASSCLMAGIILQRSERLVTVNQQKPQDAIYNAASTPYPNYLSPANPMEQRYPNGSSKATTSYAPKVDQGRISPEGLETSTYFYPPPPPVGLPALRAMPYPLPSTDTQRHCPARTHPDDLTVTLPSELYLERFTKCGQKIVVEFENVGGQAWSGPKNNITLTLINAFDSQRRTEIGRTLMLSEKAWKEVTGNAVINKFESWPVKYFFVVSERDDKGQVNENGESESDGNSTTVYGSNNSSSSDDPRTSNS
ncbi:uncharacterized protein MELLADRAFT_62280 [Melampsora larici-populina 98AG31]|uniref:Secreted protein n=1 Tax=Melampsora larici-populina (strain 98AG31 / pathotype 3-4-7) TaxID=747676 RepID=F4RI91_MELLP|nr:uncharacterized protein MELLADRAFT_62280 [Melampsora larici-populina 98AG31]EGG08005.1 secreted protein [Melampsora larici-populina 98AG31]